MADSTPKMRGTSLKRHEEIMRANDAIGRARAAGMGALGLTQSADRLGTPGTTGKTIA